MAKSDSLSDSGSPRDQQQSEPPVSGFTAVNGREQSTSTAGSSVINGNTSERKGSDERPNGQNGNGNSNGNGNGNSNGQARGSPPGQERLTLTTNTRREDWSQAQHGGDSNSQPPQHGSTTTPYSDVESRHKRKRSESDIQPPNPHPYHNHGLPKSPPRVVPQESAPPTELHRDMATRPAPYPEKRDYYDSPSQQYTPTANESREPVQNGWSSHSNQEHRSPYDSVHSAQTPSIHSADDRIMSEALRREIHGEPHSAHSQNGYGTGSPGDDESRGGAYGNAYGQDQNSVQMQADMKKRKRNFSNRTKTGCMTCRRRKKKCDEGRPECNNCMRGGFVCAGYPARGNWTKPSDKQAPIPLQSKDGYDPSPTSYAVQPSYPPISLPTTNPPVNLPPAQPRREPLPGYRGQQPPLRVDPQHVKLTADDDRPSASTQASASATSPEGRMATPAYSFPTPTSAASPYSQKTYGSNSRPPPPLLDPLRQESDLPTPQSAQSNGLPSHVSILHQPNTSSPHTPQSSFQVAAQQALALSTGPTVSRARTQKEEMLAGRHYFPFDKELVLERERCNSACWRFNNSTNPNNGVSPDERARLFRDVLQPRDQVNISPTIVSADSPIGKVGTNVVVEAPFNCDYGYNISIGQDVSIGKNCTILDSVEVKIGDRCMIGPNVNIYTTTLPIDPVRRLGSRGPAYGKPIIIEEDCFIGGNVTILPGVTIHRGSTVGAGSVVKCDVPRNVIFTGYPTSTSTIRSIYQDR